MYASHDLLRKLTAHRPSLSTEAGRLYELAETRGLLLEVGSVWTRGEGPFFEFKGPDVGAVGHWPQDNLKTMFRNQACHNACAMWNTQILSGSTEIGHCIFGVDDNRVIRGCVIGDSAKQQIEKELAESFGKQFSSLEWQSTPQFVPYRLEFVRVRDKTVDQPVYIVVLKAFPIVFNGPPQWIVGKDQVAWKRSAIVGGKAETAKFVAADYRVFMMRTAWQQPSTTVVTEVDRNMSTSSSSTISASQE